MSSVQAVIFQGLVRLKFSGLSAAWCVVNMLIAVCSVLFCPVFLSPSTSEARSLRPERTICWTNVITHAARHVDTNTHTPPEAGYLDFWLIVYRGKERDPAGIKWLIYLVSLCFCHAVFMFKLVLTSDQGLCSRVVTASWHVWHLCEWTVIMPSLSIQGPFVQPWTTSTKWISSEVHENNEAHWTCRWDVYGQLSKMSCIKIHFNKHHWLIVGSSSGNCTFLHGLNAPLLFPFKSIYQQ